MSTIRRNHLLCLRDCLEYVAFAISDLLTPGQTRTTAAILIAAGLQAIVFFTGAFYLPLYYQILGASATGAGVRCVGFTHLFLNLCFR